MFTGIIRHLGTIEQIQSKSARTKTLTVSTPVSQNLDQADSIAVNGVCLTVLTATDDSWQARLMAETIKKTNLGGLQPNSIVNLEQPLTLNQPLDGHFVQGHVDGTCTIEHIKAVGDDRIFTFRPPPKLMPYLIPKGSVALDGVSLTVVVVDQAAFSVSMMPYTLKMTTFGQRIVGDRVNIEVDMIGRYVHSFAIQPKGPSSKLQPLPGAWSRQDKTTAGNEAS
jgi:riboflavin synthase